MLLDLLMKHQLVDAIVLSQLPDIKRWNEERAPEGLVFNKDLEMSMLNEEYYEFLNAKTAVKRFDGLLDYAFVLGGTISKWLHHPDTSEDMIQFLDKYFGHFIDLYVVFTKYMAKEYPDLDMQQLPAFINQGLAIVVAANDRKGHEKNAEGKVQKPKDFVGPEAELQELLDGFVPAN